MKHAALALVLFAAASTALAGGADSSSALRCGVIVGGKNLAYNAGEEMQKQKFQQFTSLAGTAQAEPLRFSLSAAAAQHETDPLPSTTNSSDARLPAKLTLATIGCSW